MFRKLLLTPIESIQIGSNLPRRQEAQLIAKCLGNLIVRFSYEIDLIALFTFRDAKARDLEVIKTSVVLDVCFVCDRCGPNFNLTTFWTRAGKRAGSAINIVCHCHTQGS